MDFIGRQEELEILRRFRRKRSASLIVIRGRRRIGKSRLIEEFAKEFPRAYIFSGLPPEKHTTAEKQKKEIILQMQRQLIPRFGSDDWSDLFFDMATHCKTGPTLVALDEISWMGFKDPVFLGKLNIAWDLYFKKNPQLILILSGSNSTWIKKNILSSTGFVGRISYRLKLEELPLKVCRQFLWSTDEQIASYEFFKILSVTGGIPRYLEEMQPHLTAEENIRNVCFDRGGLLFNEFDQIFSTLFSQRFETYRKIVQSLTNGPKRIQQIAHYLERTPGGDLSEYLDDLIQTGFVARIQSWHLQDGKKGKFVRFRICDNYIRFYLQFIAPIRQHIESRKVSQLPKAWHAILGLQFESLVINHGEELHKALKLSEDDILCAGPYFQTKTRAYPGCQIDYLIQTKFDSLFLCEIKFSRLPLGSDVIEEVREKIQRLQRPRGMSIRSVLVHVNGVTDELLARDFFSHIIDFAELSNY